MNENLMLSAYFKYTDRVYDYTYYCRVTSVDINKKTAEVFVIREDDDDNYSILFSHTLPLSIRNHYQEIGGSEFNDKYKKWLEQVG